MSGLEHVDWYIHPSRLEPGSTDRGHAVHETSQHRAEGVIIEPEPPCT
jgi:hypothetical protein